MPRFRRSRPQSPIKMHVHGHHVSLPSCVPMSRYAAYSAVSVRTIKMLFAFCPLSPIFAAISFSLSVDTPPPLLILSRYAAAVSRKAQPARVSIYVTPAVPFVLQVILPLSDFPCHRHFFVAAIIFARA